jgi:hypothetical protein
MPGSGKLIAKHLSASILWVNLDVGVFGKYD